MRSGRHPLGSDPDPPPSYNEVVHLPQPAAAPMAPILVVPQQQQPSAETQAIYVHDGAQVVLCSTGHHHQAPKKKTWNRSITAYLCVLGMLCCNCCGYHCRCDACLGFFH